MYIIRNLLRYIINAKHCISSSRRKDARWRVMRYKGGLPPLMICTALRAAMIYQACGLDKQKQNIGLPTNVLFLLVGEGGFGPPKAKLTDLQSAPFGRSGNPPYYEASLGEAFFGAGDRSRTNNLLITNQLLCH